METAPLSAFSFNLGLNHVGDINPSIEARMGIAPAQVTFDGKVSYTDGMTGYSVAGPFGGVADPNYGLTAELSKQLDFGKLEASLNLNANPDGLTNGRVATGVTAPLSDNWTVTHASVSDSTATACPASTAPSARTTAPAARRSG